MFILAAAFGRADTLTVDPGSPVTIEVTATGTAPFTYQWRKDGVAISGATASTYHIASAVAGSAGAYTVQVANNAGSTISDSAVLTVRSTATAPAITTQPASLAVTEGAQATLSVVASGTGLSYQWLKNGTAISGATGSSLSFTSARSTDAGTYQVKVINAAATILSSSAVLTVNAAATAPVITTQPGPATKTVEEGSPITFSVTATGSSLSYQWQRNGVNISGATGRSYTISALKLTDAAWYRVRVYNTAGSVWSSAVTLTVSPKVVAPTISTHPAVRTVTEGNSVSFSVVASGTALSYQWLKDGAVISGATGSTLNFTSAKLTDAASYSVRVSNTAATVTSNSAKLTVNPLVVAPTIRTQPVAVTVTEGESATFTVIADGTSPSYRWQKNGSVISGATGSTFTLPSTSLADAGSYSVVITNASGTVTSQGAALTVNRRVVAPAIVTQPAALTATEGGVATFSIVASGQPLNYQWQKNGLSIPGASGSSYTISAAAFSDEGSYSVVVSNSAGSVTSLPAMLVVNPSMDFTELVPAVLSASTGTPGAVFDHAPETSWRDTATAPWLQIQFNEPTALDAYSLISSDNAQCDPSAWVLLGSNDGVTWNRVDSRENVLWTGRMIARDFVLPAKSAAYTQYRFEFTPAVGGVIQLGEVELYGSTVVSVLLKPASYSARGEASTTYSIAKLFDGLATTKWSDHSSTSWVRMSMGGATTLRRYTITSAADYAVCDPTGWTLSGSNDGVNWTVIETRTGESWKSRKLKRDFTLPAASARYVWFKLDFQIIASEHTTHVAELELFGEK